MSKLKELLDSGTTPQLQRYLYQNADALAELIEAAESAANVLASNGVTVAAEELRDAIRQLDEK